MAKMKSIISLMLFLFVSFFNAHAQCAMCRAVLETEDGQSTAEGVNNGIMFLMSIPYLLVAGFGFIIYWKFFRVKRAN